MMRHHDTAYGTGYTLALPYDDAVQRTKAALADAGFGVVSEIDMAATLHRKLGVDVRPYVILGACDAAQANQALAAEPDIGLLLPCNVVVYAADEPGTSVVSALDPEAMMGLARNPALEPVADEVGARLRHAIAGLAVASPAHPAPADAVVEVADEIC